MLFKILKLSLLLWSTIKSAALVKKIAYKIQIFQNFNLLPVHLPISICSKVKVCPVFFYYQSVHSDKMSSDIFIDLPVIWEPGIYCDDEANIL